MTKRTMMRGSLLAILALALVPACSGRGCKGTPPGGATPPGTPPAAGTAKEPSPSPAPPPRAYDVLASVAHLVPSSARIVATFPVASAKALLEQLPSVWADGVRAEDWESFRKRISGLWGVDATSSEGRCIFVVTVEGGPFLSCDSVKATPPGESNVWKQEGAGGWVVQRNGMDTWVGIFQDRLLAGTPAAIQVAIRTANKLQPALTEILPRIETPFRDLDSADRQNDTAVWFLDRQAAPWCKAGCQRTAGFRGPDGFSLTVVAEPNLVVPVRAAVEGWWDNVRSDTEALAATIPAPGQPATPTVRHLPLELVKRARLAVVGSEISSRGERVEITGRADPAWLAFALRSDLVRMFFGEGKRPTP